MTARPQETVPSSPAPVPPPAESWVVGRLYRLITAILGLLILGAAFLPLISGGHDVAAEPSASATPA